MSDAYRALRRSEEAFEFLRRGLELAGQVGDPLQHAKMHHLLGAVHEQRGEYADALRAYRSALLHARRAAAPADQARAHRRIGDILAVLRGPAAARQQWRRALELFEELKLPEAQELRNLLGQAETG
jgi:tetratricopeptide (TPR) repeat protein